MKATKENKVYCIDESQQKFYSDAGFDILDDDGTIISHGRGKTVSYEQYVALEAEVEALKEASPEEDDEATLEIVRAYADDHGIDLGKSTSIAGIVKKIQAAMEGGESGEGEGEQ